MQIALHRHATLTHTHRKAVDDRYTTSSALDSGYWLTGCVVSLRSLLTQLRAEDADPEALLASSFRQFQLQRALPALQAAIAAKVLRGWMGVLRCRRRPCACCAVTFTVPKNYRQQPGCS